MGEPPGKWTPAEATQRINEFGGREDLTLILTLHAEDRMSERDLITSDLLHLFQRGFVYEDPEPASRSGFYKYVIEGTTPNSKGRTVAAVLIPDNCPSIKVVTVMWRDEK